MKKYVIYIIIKLLMFMEYMEVYIKYLLINHLLVKKRKKQNIVIEFMV